MEKFVKCTRKCLASPLAKVGETYKVVDGPDSGNDVLVDISGVFGRYYLFDGCYEFVDAPASSLPDETLAEEMRRDNEARGVYTGDVEITEDSVGELSFSKPSGVDATLAERGARYGQFKDQAVYADGINEILQSSPNWDKMAPDQREALRIIANKIGRILNGDPNYSDSWHDIAGYAKLVDDRLNGVSK